MHGRRNVHFKLQFHGSTLCTNDLDSRNDCIHSSSKHSDRFAFTRQNALYNMIIIRSASYFLETISIYKTNQSFCDLLQASNYAQVA